MSTNRARYDLSPNANAAIGQALRQRKGEIDRSAIDEKLNLLRVHADLRRQTLLHAEIHGTFTKVEKMLGHKRVMARDNLARIIGDLNYLVCSIFAVDDKRAIFEGLIEQQLIEHRHTPSSESELSSPVVPEIFSEPPRSDEELGRELREAAEACLANTKLTKERIESAKDEADPDEIIVSRLADGCLELILSELCRLGILGICEYCGRCLYPESPRKECCSLLYEQRNCSANRRHARSYLRQKARSALVDPSE